jgi:hypothetical protein
VLLLLLDGHARSKPPYLHRRHPGPGPCGEGAAAAYRARKALD